MLFIGAAHLAVLYWFSELAEHFNFLRTLKTLISGFHYYRLPLFARGVTWKPGSKTTSIDCVLESSPRIALSIPSTKGILNLDIFELEIMKYLIFSYEANIMLLMCF